MIDPRRPGRYDRIYKQLEDLTAKSPSLLAAMATICALLHAKMPHHSWTGFYFLSPNGELHVGPYQGPVACQVLGEAGVCREAVRTSRAVVVPDVHAFPGHVACDSRSLSEIVVPYGREDAVAGVLDIDSHKSAQFDEDDIEPLERILSLLRPWL